ncbi:hypothetical protein T484DRAFT_1767314, partial [Baffinella frigidus]
AVVCSAKRETGGASGRDGTRQGETGAASGCMLHAARCGCGQGAFLIMAEATVLLVQDDWQIKWGSPYCDAYGEEDPDLRRGARLSLDPARWARLEAVWRSQPLRRWNQKGWTNPASRRRGGGLPF